MGGSNPSFQIPGAVQVGGVFGGGSAPFSGGGGSGTASFAAYEWYNVGGPTDVNFEKGVLDWNANIARIRTVAGGTGALRALLVSGANSQLLLQAASPAIELRRDTTGIAVLSRITSLGLTSAAAGQVGLAIDPVINQTGTASYTALDVNPTETSTGSGTKLLQRWAVGGVQKAAMFNDGVLVMPVFTVAGLPAAANRTYGRCFVSDATAPVFGSTVVGGGAVKIPVWSDGVNWIVG